MFSPCLTYARSGSPNYNNRAALQPVDRRMNCGSRICECASPDAGGRNSSRRRHGAAKALAYDTGVSLRNSYLRSL